MKSPLLLTSTFVIGLLPACIVEKKETANPVASCTIQNESSAGLEFLCQNSDGSTRVVSLPAPKNGNDGKDGANGENGKDGAKGENGKDGAPGKDGAKGENGEDGAPGRDGAKGENGKDGAPGKDGTSCSVTTLDDAYALTCPNAVGELETVYIRNGMDGQAGMDGTGCVAAQDKDQIVFTCGQTEIRIDIKAQICELQGRSLFQGQCVDLPTQPATIEETDVQLMPMSACESKYGMGCMETYTRSQSCDLSYWKPVDSCSTETYKVACVLPGDKSVTWSTSKCSAGAISMGVVEVTTREEVMKTLGLSSKKGFSTRVDPLLESLYCTAELQRNILLPNGDLLAKGSQLLQLDSESVLYYNGKTYGTVTLSSGSFSSACGSSYLIMGAPAQTWLFKALDAFSDRELKNRVCTFPTGPIKDLRKSKTGFDLYELSGDAVSKVCKRTNVYINRGAEGLIDLRGKPRG